MKKGTQREREKEMGEVRREGRGEESGERKTGRHREKDSWDREGGREMGV